MIFNFIAALFIAQFLIVVVLKVATLFDHVKGKAEIPEAPVIVSQSGPRYDWSGEQTELRGKTPQQQRVILDRWIADVVESMHCPRATAERFFELNLGTY